MLDSERNNMKRSYLMFRPEDVEISDGGAILSGFLPDTVQGQAFL
ncbi:hypothetical protein Psfp_03505 [Pelotomaculum sp. FP]|nr:hypothetical protein Psfp_03505 [Pelotomaculum sp. FP]